MITGPDLWTIIDEKLPFVSLPPNEMFPESLKSPISPYYTIQADNELTLGRLYIHQFTFLTLLKTEIGSLHSLHTKETAFAYFNVLPKSAKFGFDQQVPDLIKTDNGRNLENYIKNASTMEELFIALIHSLNEQKLIQYEIADYESLLNRLLEIQEVDEGEG